METITVMTANTDTDIDYPNNSVDLIGKVIISIISIFYARNQGFLTGYYLPNHMFTR